MSQAHAERPICGDYVWSVNTIQQMAYRMVRFTTLSLILAMAAPAMAQNLIANGSFEDPDIDSNSITSISPTVPSWSGVPFILDGEPDLAFPKSGSIGDQYADVGNSPGAVASQLFTVPTGQLLYELSFDANGSTNAASSVFRVEIWDGGGSLILFGEDATTATSDTSWMPFSYDLTPESIGAGSYELRFFGTSGGGSNDTLIDNVRLVAVPEPTSLALVLAGLCGFGIRRR